MPRRPVLIYGTLLSAVFLLINAVLGLMWARRTSNLLRRVLTGLETAVDALSPSSTEHD